MHQQLDQIEKDGYAVFRNFLDKATTSRIRAHMDSLLPPPEARDDALARRLFELRHPIPGANIAEIVNNPRLIELATALLYADELRLLWATRGVSEPTICNRLVSPCGSTWVNGPTAVAA